jgi:ribA/ribD-fused uncharacterized protein
MKELLTLEKVKELEAMMLKDGDIRFYSTKGPFGWMSNFYKSIQILDNVVYWTNEHYYQSQKSTRNDLRNWIASAPTAYAAMIAGRQCLRQKRDFDLEWDIRKAQVMKTGLFAKFSQNPVLWKKLVDTGNAIIHENSPDDLYWGVKGQDMLGQLIMQVREELNYAPYPSI